MFWNKKDAKGGLPDLPPSTNNSIRMPEDPAMSSEHNSNNLGHHDNLDDTDHDAGLPGKNGLPSFPDSPMRRGFSQSAIKDAVAHESTDQETITRPQDESAFKTMELGEFTPPKSNIPSLPSTSPPMTSSIPAPPMSSAPAKIVTAEIDSPMPTGFPQASMTPLMESPASPAVEHIVASPAPIATPVAPRTQKSNKDIFIKIDKFYGAKKTLNTTNEQLEDIDTLLKKIRETKQKEEQELAAWEKEIATIKARIKEVTTTIFEKTE